MASTDCGFCVLLANCDAQISNAWDFYTFASKMLCEIADNTGAFGPSEDVNVAEVGGVAVTIADFQNLASVGGAAVTIADFQDLASVGGAAVTIADFQQGNVAHDAADSGNPLKIGYRARTSDITAVANDDRTDSIGDKIGRLVVAPYSIPEDEVKGTTGDIVDTTSTSVIAAVASRKLYITSITVSNMSSAVATRVDLQDGSGGAAIWQGPAAAAGGGFTHTFPTPIATTSGNGLFAACGTTAAQVRVSAAGYSGV